MKNLIGVLLLLGLFLATYFIFFHKPIVDERGDFKDFAIEDTASISKIFISNPEGAKVLLSRNVGREWWVNNEFPARKDAIELVLTTIHDIKVRGSVSKKTFNSVVKKLATSSIKVELYSENDSEPEKIWYVGFPTADRMGTYMLLEKNKEKSKNPYITYLLQERGFLGPRFFIEPELWRDPVLLKLNPKKIKKIRVDHLYDTATSFSVEKLSEREFSIENLKTNQKHLLTNEKAIPYFKDFSKVFYEMIDNKTDQEELDSIYSSRPRHQVSISFEDGNSLTVKTYNIPMPKGAMLEGKPLLYNPERMYAFSSYMGEKVHPIVQNRTFDKLVPVFEYFTSSTNVEK